MPDVGSRDTYGKIAASLGLTYSPGHSGWSDASWMQWRAHPISAHDLSRAYNVLTEDGYHFNLHTENRSWPDTTVHLDLAEQEDRERRRITVGLLNRRGLTRDEISKLELFVESMHSFSFPNLSFRSARKDEHALSFRL